MTSPAHPWADYLRSDQRRVLQTSLASWWSCYIQNAVVCSTCSQPRTPPEFLSLAYRSISLTWKYLNLGSNIPTLCSDLASPSLSSALLGSNVTLPSTNLLQSCRAQAVEKLSSLLPCAITTGADHGLGKTGNVIYKPFHSLLPASPLWMAATSRTGGGWRYPQIILLSLCPKLLWSLLPFPALTLTAVIPPVSQAVVTYGEGGKSNGISRAPENLRW